MLNDNKALVATPSKQRLLKIKIPQLFGETMRASQMISIITLIIQIFINSFSFAQDISLAPSCGNLTENTFGKPIDYNSADRDLIQNVESHHFPAHVENLIRGNTGTLGADIDYTLRTFPNHHRALMAMSNLGRKEKSEKPKDSKFTVNCWFQRAIIFKPEDGMVRMVYGIDLMKRNKYQDAIAQFIKANEQMPSNGNLFYNLGLAYYEVGDYNNALVYAHKANLAGFRLPGLKIKLESKHKWKEILPDQINGIN